MYGGFAGFEGSVAERVGSVEETKLSGDLGTPALADDNAYHVLSILGAVPIGEISVVDGFHVSGGNANGAALADQRGAGITISGAGLTSAVRIEGCILESNSAISSGGALWCSQSSPQILACTFRANHAEGGGGAIMVTKSSPTLEDCLFSENTAGHDGGALIAESFPPAETTFSTLRRCTFERNMAGLSATMRQGGAIFCFTDPTWIESCVFLGNEIPTGNGGALSIQEDTDQTQIAVVVNSLFVGNTAERAGAMYVRTATPDPPVPLIVNCTVFGNHALTGGVSAGGIEAASSGTPETVNCILWGNTRTPGCVQDATAQFIPGSTLNLEFSCVEDLAGLGSPSATNIGADPQFALPAGCDFALATLDDDLHLDALSPCVDAGDSAAVPTGVTTDLDGSLRVQGAAVDMGCYEDTVTVITPSETVRAGSPPNPIVLLPAVSGAPVLGGVWDPFIDHTFFAGDALKDVLGIFEFGLSPGTATAFGTLLCDITSVGIAVESPGVGQPFAVPVPSTDCALLGVSLCAQGVSITPSTAALTNALDIVIGPPPYPGSACE